MYIYEPEVLVPVLDVPGRDTWTCLPPVPGSQTRYSSPPGRAGLQTAGKQTV